MIPAPRLALGYRTRAEMDTGVDRVPAAGYPEGTQETPATAPVRHPAALDGP